MHDGSEPAPPTTRPDAERNQASKVVITFSEIISALSFAIDLTEDAVPGHALRSCLLGMRIGRTSGLPPRELESLYYALLLKDIGCSSNASRFGQIVRGEEAALKSSHLPATGSDPDQANAATLMSLQEEMRSEAPLRQRFRRILHMGARRRRSDRDAILLRSKRGANITRKLGLSAATCDAVFALDEHWDGSGSPLHAQGQAIPTLARIVAVAEHLDAFACELTPAAALAVLRDRSGRWFDPELVLVAYALDRSGQLWEQCLPTDDLNGIRQLVIGLDPKAPDGVGAEEIDRICEAFADVVDAKSPFTYRHSVGVARVAVAMADTLALPPDRLELVHRAALLHDLGKLSIPNTILDKTSRLSPDEWHTVMEHPRLTHQILSRIEPFTEIAEIAAAHHEKLDGSGYPNGLREDQLTIESRVIAVADIYRALTESRPYRLGLSHAAAMQKLRLLTPHQLDARCVDALDHCCNPALGAPAVELDNTAPTRKPPNPAQEDRNYRATA